ncbi:unnamed protein product [Clavelina lepadiformis]|uniref:Uncharacterized protein n=1 Tax=Clavelina lepadiformis TaxID=159417 RepID=A0ABP0FYU8_CLALP
MFFLFSYVNPSSRNLQHVYRVVALWNELPPPRRYGEHMLPRRPSFEQLDGLLLWTPIRLNEKTKPTTQCVTDKKCDGIKFQLFIRPPPTGVYAGIMFKVSKNRSQNRNNVDIANYRRDKFHFLLGLNSTGTFTTQ